MVCDKKSNFRWSKRKLTYNLSCVNKYKSPFHWTEIDIELMVLQSTHQRPRHI